jgi:Fur family peroxide stress response transcriptional regulator
MEPGTKHFRKRDAILTYLRHTREHPSAETVYAALKPQIPDLSLGTVYRNISLFKQQGLIVSLGSVNGVERYDGNIDPHVHFVCTGCGSILDLHNMHVPEELNNAASVEANAVVDHCHLTFHGRCRACV